MKDTREIMAELKHTAIEMFNHGRTEMAAAILGNHQGHVMYMHTEKEKEVDQPLHEPEHQQEDHEREM